MAGHYQQVCEFGLVHGQCRCPAPNKMQVTITCTMPDAHSKMTGLKPKTGSMKTEIRKPMMDALANQFDHGDMIDGKVVFDPDEDDYYVHVRLDEKVLVLKLENITL